MKANVNMTKLSFLNFFFIKIDVNFDFKAILNGFLSHRRIKDSFIRIVNEKI